MINQKYCYFCCKISENKKFFIPKCKHCIHKHCARQLKSNKCIECNRKINWPSDILKCIKDNNTKKKIKCCVCWEPYSENNKLFRTKCLHYIHKNCASQLVKEDCPVCRKKIKWPPDILQKIQNNKEQYRKECRAQENEIGYQVAQEIEQLQPISSLLRIATREIDEINDVLRDVNRINLLHIGSNYRASELC